MTMKMKELPISERPYEKLEMYGENALSNAELLAIIIKSGTKEESSVTLAQKILSLGKNYQQNNLSFLQELSLQELMQIRGVGKVKAIQLKATCELAKRITKPIDQTKVEIKTDKDIANLVINELRLEKREIVKVIILNSQNTVEKIQTVSLGGSTFASLEKKYILLEAVKRQAPKIAIVHNHPNGNHMPSLQDCKATLELEKIAQELGIELLDHIIIADNKHTSIKGYIKQLQMRK